MVNPLKLSDAYCVCIQTIGADNGLSPGWHQSMFWTNAETVLTALLGTKFSQTLIEIITFSFSKMHLKMSFAYFVPASMRWELARRNSHESDSIMLWSMMARELLFCCNTGYGDVLLDMGVPL